MSENNSIMDGFFLLKNIMMEFIEWIKLYAYIYLYVFIYIINILYYYKFIKKINKYVTCVLPMLTCKRLMWYKNNAWHTFVF